MDHLGEPMKHCFLPAGAVLACLALSACAIRHAARPASQVESPGQVNLVVDDTGGMASGADEQQVLDAVKMIEAGRIQLAIDGPLAAVIDKYEARYAGKPVKVFCAEGLSDGLVYAALGQQAVAGAGRTVQVLGPAWARAYWARGFAYDEMARYDNAVRELDKALALSPMNSQYKSELAYVWGRKGEWKKSLALYRDAHEDAFISGVGGAAEVTTLRCEALRGQGYALVELHRLGDAAKAFQACLELQPGEPKSLGELEYIQQLQAKSR